MQFRINGRVSAVLVVFILLCLLPASCLLGGAGLLMLRPSATPTMSLVESVRATATAEALEIAVQPAPTNTPTVTPEPTATDIPPPTVEPLTTGPFEPTPQPTGTPLPMPTVRQPTATNVPRSTSTSSPMPTPTKTLEPPPTPPPATGLTRGPYLQWVRPRSIIIAWETAQEVDSVVEYGPTEAYGSTAGDYTWTTRHAVSLTGLSPHTTYHYRVKTSTQVLSGDSTFKTAAGPGETSFTFAVLADTHAGLDADEFPRRRRQVDDHHRRAVGEIMAADPAFYLLAGDLVQEGPDSVAWNDFMAIQGQLMSKVAAFPAIGNHGRNHQNYFGLFHLPHNERWYSFDYGDAHFIALQVDGYADVSPGSEQYRWLENDLANSDKTWKIAFFHFPLFSCGLEGPDLRARAALHPLFVQYGVHMAFHGHDHNYQRHAVDDVSYIVTGGGGGGTWGLGGCDRWPEHWEETRHVVKVRVTNNTLSSVAIRIPDGSEFDHFTLAAD